MKIYEAKRQFIAALVSIELAMERNPVQAKLQIRYLIDRLDTGKIDFEGAGSSPAGRVLGEC